MYSFVLFLPHLRYFFSVMIMSFTKRTRFGALLSLFVASANISLAATSPADLVAALKDSPTQVSQLSLLQDSDASTRLRLDRL